MAKKNDQDKKKDLAELEKKVDELMSLEPLETTSEPSSAPKKISVIHDEADAEPATAPPVSKPKKATKIAISEVAEEPEETGDLLTQEPDAIEVTTAPVLDDTEEAVVIPEKADEPEPAIVPEESPVHEAPEDILDPALTIEEVEAKVHEEPQFIAAREELSEAIDPAKLASGTGISESEAIDDIVAQESDAIMDIEDRQRAALNADPVKKKTFIRRFGTFLASFIVQKRRRAALLSVIFVAAVVTFAVPTSRYAVLNAAGVRSASSIKVLDKKTFKPLKNVEVTIGNVSAKTDKNGTAKLSQVKLGPQNMQIKLPAFDVEKKRVTIGWGSNPLGEVQLTPRGSHYNFKFSDYLSSKAINDIEVTTEDGISTATTNDQGEASLVVEDTKATEVVVKVSGQGYRAETLMLDRSDERVREYQLVPDKKHVFVSKRNGKYDLYAVAVDGKEETLLLKASGSENPDNLMIVPAVKKNYVAFVTSRDNMRNKDGYLLSSLYVINTDDKTNKIVTKSERVQVIGWFDNRLVYVKMTEGASAENVNRHKLMSYDIESGSEKELATANYFNDVVSANGAIYYAPTSLKLESGAIGFFKINPDGSNKQRLVSQETWNILRQSYDKLTISLGNDWAEYAINDNKTNRLPGAPATNDSKLYIDFDQTKSIVVDQRDGKGVILLREQGKDEKEIKSGSGIANPLYWLNSTSIVYRVKNATETADYAINIHGGEAKKIADVTNTAGIDRWYYY